MSFKACSDPRRRTYIRMIGDIQHELNQALVEEFASRGLTKTKMASELGRNKSFITRKLNGSDNMTLETLADLAFALNRPVRISLPSREKLGGGNYFNQTTTTTPPGVFHTTFSNMPESISLKTSSEHSVIWTSV